MNYTTLISAEQLKALLQSGQPLRLFDCRLAYTELLWIIVAAAILLKSLAAQPVLAAEGVALAPQRHDPRPAHWPRPRFGRGR